MAQPTTRCHCSGMGTIDLDTGPDCWAPSERKAGELLGQLKKGRGMTPQLSVHCTYPGTSLPPTCVTFGLSPEYGIHTASEAHDWFLGMMREHEEFDVETDEPGEECVPFWSETVREVLVE